MSWTVLGNLLKREPEMNPEFIQLDAKAHSWVCLSNEDWDLLILALNYFRAVACDQVSNGVLPYLKRLGEISEESYENSSVLLMSMKTNKKQWDLLSKENGIPNQQGSSDA